jgi:hypothetical protein
LTLLSELQDTVPQIGFLLLQCMYTTRAHPLRAYYSI